ncbi:MAG: PAS domain S-box protein [Ignavibacteria bacterium]|jgi:PAS domain S-box-containing protein|nr:PAS domain S-box protein [Ignavibacteria bacterium]MCU7500082.1 PAS domain S-box protein [Ignavibacteria bacterium]MCU7513418.1 PAS domain S-box protein [Ignavibacteria bacterium]MCU7522189.1 PAS domain S-box protein [Ignavibacteria bacterium]MCU7525121.1 PAS domain S-box protein [Ignavibacteria bacterium]
MRSEINNINENLTGFSELKESLSDTSYELASLKFALDEAAIVAITDIKGTITYINKKFCEISKYSPEELIGQNHRIINSGFHPKEFFRDMYRTIANGRVWKGQIKNRAKDGSYYWVDTTIVPLTNREGKLSKYLAIRFDITAQKRIEEELVKALLDVEQSNSELEQFAYIASHDLQEPLRMIGSYSQLLTRRYEGKLDAKADQYINYITEGVQRMQTLIKDLLHYSRTATSKEDMQTVDLNIVMTEVLTDLKVAIETSHADIKVSPLPPLKANHTQVRQLFQNLIGNAIKFRGDESPVIEVSAQEESEVWQFSIKDNGIGIDPEYSEKIFMLFQRLNDREKYPGTGIGLAVCKKIVERHGGKIWIESEAGKGTTFFFTIRK